MNKYILSVLDRKNKTEEELAANADGAYDVWVADAAAADIATAEVYVANWVAATWAAHWSAAAADAAAWAWSAAEAAWAVACYNGAADNNINVERQLDGYFRVSGESREEYEKVIKESRG
tara:strand:- start:4056 stop:4415 length:360 start_codon:yes stop_codon:yes gene_type:complete